MKPEKYFCRTLATELRKEREAKRKSQKDVYVETNINMARLEKGDTSIDLLTFITICRYFGIESSHLLNKIESACANNLARRSRPEPQKEV